MRKLTDDKKTAVMLSPSKHSGQGVSARTLRQAQGDSALLTLFVVLFCLFLSVNAFGQTPDTTHNNTPTKWVVHEKTSLADKPLIIVDDIIYYGDLNNINPNIIESINVHKDESTLATYGPSAVDGVIIVKTKNYQKNDKARSIDSLVSNDALFVIDGEPSKNKLNDIDPNNILILNILKKGKSSDPSLGPINDVVIVVTKSAAIKAYQKRLSGFSKKYKNYLEKNQNNDEGFFYILNGTQVQGTRDEIIRTLYNIKAEKIKEVGFNKKQPTDGSITIVIINTKQ